MRKAAVDDLERSGITVREAKYAEMYSVKDASQVYPDFKELPALAIPYVDPWTDDFVQFKKDGKLFPFCRVRYYGNAPKTKSFKKTKQVRYTQPAGSGVHPYYPVCKSVDWLSVVDDPTIPIMITEGEKKALSACLAGIPTIGLGGVYNFFHDGVLLPLLDRTKWKGRPVYICYDSDAQVNNKIQAAEARLAMELSQKRRAHVFLIRLPNAPGGAKVGVDDFIVSEGEDALFDLLDRARDMLPMDKEVLRMNNDVAWVETEGMVFDLEHGNWISKSDFSTGSVYSTRKLFVPKAKGDGVVAKKVSIAWLDSPLAQRYNSVKFSPGTDQREVELPNGGIALNLFTGLDAIEGEVEPFFELHDWLLSTTDEFDKDLLWKIICYKIQNLAARIDLGIMFIGAQGSGKSMFSNIVAEMVAPYNKVMSSKELGADFNGWIEKTLIVSMVEAQAYQLKRNLNVLKTLITDKRQPMNEKFRKPRDVDSHAFFLFSSNERSAAAFADDDRRMIIIGCPGPHPDGDEFYSRISAWHHDNGPKHLLHYFQHYDLEGWTPPNSAPQTREKRMAYLASLTPIQQLAHTIRDATDNVVLNWVSSALDWAFNDPDDTALAAQIADTLTRIQIRPFYTPEELVLLFPQISSTLRNAKVRGATAVNDLSREFLQAGIAYLKCADNLDGFMWKGMIRQYFIVSNQDEFEKPISQKDFEDYMARFPTYRERKEILKEKKRKSKRKKNNNS